MDAFIVRPFGKKEGIDFDAVECKLIRPALKQLGIAGGTTGEIMRAGNIREDMFRLLLTADLVIADISIHNANVFYELGVRQALRPWRTFLIRGTDRPTKPMCEEDEPQESGSETGESVPEPIATNTDSAAGSEAKEGQQGAEASKKRESVPFDVATDRYFAYNFDEPGGDLKAFAKALEATVESEETDSPIYRLLPGLKEPNWAEFLAVPREFREAVRRAKRSGDRVRLALLTEELITLRIGWARDGLASVGVAQFSLSDWVGARQTWEAVLREDPSNIEANTKLATVYQRLASKAKDEAKRSALLQRSDDAITRVAEDEGVDKSDRAELAALQGSNAKTHWMASWQSMEGDERLRERQVTALGSPYLVASYEAYLRGFLTDCSHYYSGGNALAMATILVTLAEELSEEFAAGFPTKQDAECTLRGWKRRRAELAGAVATALGAARREVEQNKGHDPWLAVSEADLAALTSDRVSHVEAMFRKGAADVGPMMTGSVMRQLQMLEQLGVRSEYAGAGIKVLEAMQQEGQQEAGERDPECVLVFTGHRVDAPDRETPRFPLKAEEEARKRIAEKVDKVVGNAKPESVLGMAGGANGGDILFHEICEEKGIRTRMLLTGPRNAYIPRSVAHPDADWVSRFDAIRRRSGEEILADSLAVPPWLRDIEEYSVWSRTNLWLLHSAFAYGAEKVTLLALWNGQKGDGPGGTADMFSPAQSRGARVVRIDATPLAELA